MLSVFILFILSIPVNLLNLSRPTLLSRLFPSRADGRELFFREWASLQQLGILAPALRLCCSNNGRADALYAQGEAKGTADCIAQISIEKIVLKLVQALPVREHIFVVGLRPVFPNGVGDGAFGDDTHAALARSRYR